MVEEYREHDLGKGQAGVTRRNTYEPYLKAPECVFSKDVPIDAVLYEPFYQIFRMGLLGQKMIYEDKELDQVYVVPVYPRNNLAYSTHITSPWLKAKYGKNAALSDIASHMFNEPITLKPVYAHELWDVAKNCAVSAKYTEWVEYMDARYFMNGV